MGKNAITPRSSTLGVLFIFSTLLISLTSAQSGCGKFWAKTASRYCYKYCEGTSGLWCYTWKGCGWDEYCKADWACHAGIACEGENGCVQACPVAPIAETRTWKKHNRAADIPTEVIPGTSLMTGTFYNIENSCGILVTTDDPAMEECTKAERFRKEDKADVEWMMIPSEEPGYYVLVTKKHKLNKIYYQKDYKMMMGGYDDSEFQPYGSSRKSALWKFIKTSNEDNSLNAIQPYGLSEVAVAHWENTPYGPRQVIKLQSVPLTNPAAQWTFTFAGVNLVARLFELNFKESIDEVIKRNMKPQLFQRKTAINPTPVEETTTFSEEVVTNNRLQLSFGQKLGLVHTVSVQLTVIPAILTGSASTQFSAELTAGQVIEKSESKKHSFSRQVTIKPYSCTEMTYTRQVVNNAQVPFTGKLSVSGNADGMTYGGLLRTSSSKLTGNALRTYVEVAGFEGKFVEAKDLEAIYEVTGTLTADTAIDEQFLAKEIPMAKCNTSG